MNAFTRSWKITQLTFKVINQDRELIGFALLSFVFSTLFAVAMVVPSVVPTLMEDGASQSSLQVYQYVIIFLTYFGLAFIATFFNVCVVYTTKVRFEGGNATFGESIRFAFAKLGLIFQWSLLSATVGLVLKIIDNMASRLGKGGQIIVGILVAILGMTWSIVSIFVVPVLVYEGLGPVPAIKRSTQVLKKTWGESLIRHFGLGLVQFFVFVLAIAFCFGLTYVLANAFDVMGLIIGIGVWVLFMLLVGLVFSVANTIFNTALYVYASRSMVPTGFDEETVKDAFAQKR
ncbi:MAG TPA: DUF6159 family protein [Cyclobacteriaceae bacterium]|nr:DUF6159 family protein [Cyclobacteriaceae bacterium]